MSARRALRAAPLIVLVPAAVVVGAMLLPLAAAALFVGFGFLLIIDAIDDALGGYGR